MIKAKVLKLTIDENGNLKVETEYTLSDNSKHIGHTRYNTFNFSRENIAKDIKQHCETLMRKVYMLKRHIELLPTTVNDLTHECTSVEVVIQREIKDMITGVITQPKKTIIVDDK